MRSPTRSSVPTWTTSSRVRTSPLCSALYLIRVLSSDARYFSREEILTVLNGEKKGLTKEEVTRFDLQQLQEQGQDKSEPKKESVGTIRLPAS